MIFGVRVLQPEYVENLRDFAGLDTYLIESPATRKLAVSPAAGFGFATSNVKSQGFKETGLHAR